MNKDEHLVGVKGWLLVVVFSFQFIGPFSAFLHFGSAYQLVKTVVQPSSVLAYFILAESIARGTFAYLAGARLRKRFLPSSVTYAIAVLWIAGPISALIEAIVIRSAADNRLAIDFVSLLTSIAGALIWTMYLKMSQRVKNTYYPKEKAFEDVVGKEGMTALMYYAGQGDVYEASKLIDGGADVNARCENGATALIYAIFNNKEEIVRLLLDSKADTTVSTNKGATARSIALHKERKYILKMLDEAEGVLA